MMINSQGSPHLGESHIKCICLHISLVWYCKAYRLWYFNTKEFPFLQHSASWQYLIIHFSKEEYKILSSKCITYEYEYEFLKLVFQIQLWGRANKSILGNDNIEIVTIMQKVNKTNSIAAIYGGISGILWIIFRKKKHNYMRWGKQEILKPIQW